jgi:hypothetical protein
MKKGTLFCFLLLLVAFLLPNVSPLMAAWDDPSNKPDFFLGNTDDFKVQNVFINGKPLNPSVYFFTIHREVFVPVRILANALGRKITWDPVERRVFINGKELNTTRVILGPTCYVSLRSIAELCNAQVAYDTKNHSAAIWAKHPALLGYPIERWYIGTGEFYQRLNIKVKADRERAKLDAKRAELEKQGVDQSLLKDNNFVKQYGDKETNPSQTPPPVAPPPVKGPSAPPVVGPPPVVTPPVSAPTPPPPSSPTPNPGNPFHFGF